MASPTFVPDGLYVQKIPKPSARFALSKQPSKNPSALLIHGVQNISLRLLRFLISSNNGLRCVPPAANQLASP